MLNAYIFLCQLFRVQCVVSIVLQIIYYEIAVFGFGCCFGILDSWQCFFIKFILRFMVKI